MHAQAIRYFRKLLYQCRGEILFPSNSFPSVHKLCKLNRVPRGRLSRIATILDIRKREGPWKSEDVLREIGEKNQKKCIEEIQRVIVANSPIKVEIFELVHPNVGHSDIIIGHVLLRIDFVRRPRPEHVSDSRARRYLDATAAHPSLETHLEILAAPNLHP